MTIAALNRRLKAMEGKGRPSVSPAVKRWLGLDLSKAEERELEAMAPVSFSPEAVKASCLSADAKAWLLEGMCDA